MQLPAVKLQANDGEHEDSEKEQQANLEERHHSLHDGFQHNLQAWEGKEKAQLSMVMQTPLPGPCLSHLWREEMDRQSADRCKGPAQPLGIPLGI